MRYDDTVNRGALLLQEAARSGGKRGGGGSRGNRRYVRDRLGRFASTGAAAVRGFGERHPRLRAAGQQIRDDAPLALGILGGGSAGAAAGTYAAMRHGGPLLASSKKAALRAAMRGGMSGQKTNLALMGLLLGSKAAAAAAVKGPVDERPSKKYVAGYTALSAALGGAGGYLGGRLGGSKALSRTGLGDKPPKPPKRSPWGKAKDFRKSRIRAENDPWIARDRQQKRVMDEFSRTASNRWSAPRPAPHRGVGRMGPSAGGRKPYKTPNTRQLSSRSLKDWPQHGKKP